MEAAFLHKSNMRYDARLVQLRMKHGAAGYGIYMMILERLTEETANASAKDYNMIAFDLRVDTSLVKSVIEDFGLFVFTDDCKYFYSEDLNVSSDTDMQNSEKPETLREKRAAAGRKGMLKRWRKNDVSDDNKTDNKTITKQFVMDNKTITKHFVIDNENSSLSTISEEFSDNKTDNKIITKQFVIDNKTITNDNKTITKFCYEKDKEKLPLEEIPPYNPPKEVNPIKEKENNKEKDKNIITAKAVIIKNEKEADFVINPPQKRTYFKPPTLQEVKTYIEQKGAGVDAEVFWNFYESKGWVVGKSKMKNWRAAVVTWQRSNRQRNNNGNTGFSTGFSTGNSEQGDMYKPETDAEFRARILRQINGDDKA